ncbi:unnamed protein product [Ambrosiozyma monospora]|uniref:Unnamed protein product n=1 Tax=Ambrosiozyma monospora TaxID=43982 RepID=A0ACB5U606_AMBMO|nr:unnamed protein product [Ambrosiozyma monospora]
MGNTLKPEETQERPSIHFTLNVPDNNDSIKITNDDKFTLIFTDPDAPTRTDDKWSEYCHYVTTDISLNSFDSESVDAANLDTKLTTQDLSGHDLVSYVGPGPPPKTGKHRYVFLLYKQKPGVSPAQIPDRPNWGTGIPGYGAAEYAKKNGLELLAVNYFFAQNKEQ